MNLVFEKLTRSLAANEQWMTRIAGNFFRLSVAANPVTVRLLKDNREIGSMSNLLSGDYVRDVPFDAVQVENGGIGQSITIQLAGGGAGSDRVLGEVTVTGEVSTTGERVTIEAGLAYSFGILLSAQTTVYQFLRLCNPAGSGYNVFVTDLEADVQNGPGDILLLDTGFVAKPGGQVDISPVNKKSGTAADNTSEVWRSGSGSALPTGAVMWRRNAAASEAPSVKAFKHPVMVPPNGGVMLGLAVASGSFWANVDYYKRPV